MEPPTPSAGSRRSFAPSYMSHAASAVPSSLRTPQGGAVSFDRLTLRFADPVLDREYRHTLAGAVRSTLRHVIGLTALTFLGLAVLNETITTDDWIGTETPVFVSGSVLMSILTVVAYFMPETLERHQRTLTMLAGVVVIAVFMLSGLVVHEADRPYILIAVMMAISLLPHVVPLVDATKVGVLLLMIQIPTMLLDETAQLVPLGQRIAAVVMMLLSASLTCLFQYSNERSQRELFLLRRQLQRKNAQLQQQLRMVETLHTTTVDLDGPVLKVIDALRHLRDKHAADDDDHASLTMALNVIASGNQLFNTSIAEQVHAGHGIDAETKRYLFAELAQTASVTRRKAPQAKRSRNDEGTLLSLQPEEEARVAECLVELEQWSFDIFQLASVSATPPLVTIGLAVFDRLGLMERFKIDANVLWTFLSKIEAGYNKVPYHTSTHAADVLHAVYYLCNNNEVVKKYLSDVDVLALVVAAVIHDYQHPGINNNFLIATGHELAVLYNDRSVLENHHAASAFALMATEAGSDILRGMEAEERKTVRRLVIEFVLATDFSKHFELVNQFKAKLSGDGLSEESTDDTVLLCKMLIKMADISNVSKRNALSRQWADAVMAEFWLQGDKEREAGLPVSTFFDRREPLVAKCQSSFIDFLVKPMFTMLCEYLDESDIMGNLRANRETWQMESEMDDVLK